MQGNDRGLNQSPQKYETSFQQLMAQRYPQTNRSIAPAPFPQAPDLPTPGQSANQQQQMAHSLHGQQSHVQQLTSQQYRPNMTQQRQQSSPNASNGFAQGSPTGFIQRPKGMPSSASGAFQNASLSSINKHQAQARPSTASGLSKQTNTSKSSKKDSSSKQSGQTSGLVFNTPQQKDHLVNCDWKDKILWASRLILGGNSINGFLRATATAQRIKKQRARQIALTKKTAAAAAAGTPSGEKEDKVKDNSKKAFDQAEEEKLKKDIMNPRTAKKIKSELEAGLQFCAAMHNVLRKALFEIDPAQTPYLPPNIFLEDDKPAVPSVLIPSIPKQGASYQQTLPNASVLADMPWAVKSNAAGGPQASYTKKGIQSQPGNSMFNHPLNMAKNQPPGNPDGSSLRKLRKKKLPPSNEPPVFIPEFDGSGKRIYTKKEHNYRLFELLRFRPLRQGDFVAARLSSRDLWILARVLKDYPGTNMAPLEFLNLTGARRDAVFRDRVLLKDVEEKDEESSVQVLRSLALPLPRTHSEAAEWGQR